MDLYGTAQSLADLIANGLQNPKLCMKIYIAKVFKYALKAWKYTL
jgi:hypothetical protein